MFVKFPLRQPLANPPAGFTINNPPRIAFDFPDTDNALGKTTQEVGDGELRNMNIVQAAGRTRLVMNLAKPVGYDTKIDGKMVLITLQTSAPSTAGAAVTFPFAATKTADTRQQPAHLQLR